MAGEYCCGGAGLNWEDGIAALVPGDFCAQRPQAVGGGLNVPVGVQAV